MPISETIAAITSAIEATRAELAIVNGKIDDLQAERQRFESMPPHTEDIIAALLRGLDEQSDLFERQLSARLNETYVGPDSARSAAASKAPQILRLEPHKADPQEVMTRAMKGQTMPDLNVTALTYFLHSSIASQVPALVGRLCPAAKDGITDGARKTALAGIAERMSALEKERDRLVADLGAARAAIIR